MRLANRDLLPLLREEPLFTIANSVTPTVDFVAL